MKNPFLSLPPIWRHLKMFFPRPSHIESWGWFAIGRAGQGWGAALSHRCVVVCCLSKRSVREAEPTNTHPSVNLQSLQSLKMSLPLGGVGGVKREDAVKFLERVQQRLNSRPQDYADFLNIMKVGNLSMFSPILMKVFRNCNQKVSQWKVRSKKSRIFSRYTISVI